MMTCQISTRHVIKLSPVGTLLDTVLHRVAIHARHNIHTECLHRCS